MADHTPIEVGLPAWLPMTGDGPLVRYDWDRVKACLEACAGIPTDQLGDVKALVEAAADAEHFFGLEFEEDGEIARRVRRPLFEALDPFLRKD